MHWWLLRSYDPETTISDRVEFENERVEFLTGIANLMATKARLKMNTKKLYASDGRAVQELLKLATLLNRLVLQCSEILKLYILHDCQYVPLIPKQF
jgi:Clusterin-associated protein-1